MVSEEDFQKNPHVINLHGKFMSDVSLHEILSHLANILLKVI